MKFKDTRTALASDIEDILCRGLLTDFFTRAELECYDQPSARRSLLARWLVKSMLRERLGETFAFTDFSIGNDPSGAPCLCCTHPDFARRLHEMGCTSVFLSFSHSRRHVGALIIYA